MERIPSETNHRSPAENLHLGISTRKSRILTTDWVIKIVWDGGEFLYHLGMQTRGRRGAPGKVEDGGDGARG
jgi:hypothetical protein